MQLVQDNLVQTRFSNGFPRTVEMLCPHCLKEAMFEARPWQEHGRQMAASELECTRCERTVLFLSLIHI